MLVLSQLFKSLMAGQSPLRRPDPIFSLLQEHKKKHTLIYLSLGPNQKTLYQSIIVDIDKNRQRLHIDDIFPRQIKLKHNQRITVSMRDAKHHWQNFQTRIIDNKNEKLLFGHLLELPEYITGEQRRQAYRVHINGDCFWNSQGYRQHHSEIRDISASGIQLTLGHFYRDQMEPDQVLHNCQLQIPNLELECDLSITRVLDEAIIHQEMHAPLTDDEHITLGARFLGLDAGDKRKLESYLMEEQRQRRQQSALSL
ncbi:MAG: hypothetical protein CL693_13365 [Cellvibrionaceae bacterium]|nr:hypothetical protein [Cellvibrionaceae bacterium]